MSRRNRRRRRMLHEASQSMDRYRSTCEACGATQADDRERRKHQKETGHRHFTLVPRAPADTYMTRST